LAQILAQPMAHGVRYKPFGVMVGKEWLFEQGGRPVIYQPASEFELLHERQRFRHVRYEPPTVDFTWEREWRVETDRLELDPARVSLVVPDRKWERWAQSRHVAMLARRALGTMGRIGPRSVAEFPWHFVVLEDLGVAMPRIDPPPDA
jgi:hypothetical protein